MRSEISTQIGGLLQNMMGLNPEDVLPDEEIRKHLSDAFNKFDKDVDGKLNKWEFTQTWIFLGLKGTQTEIDDSFRKVDTDRSGFVDLEEFIKAIRSDRLAELSLKKVFDKLGVKVSGINNKYEAFAKTVKRRRLLKKKMEENIEKSTQSIIKKLLAISNKKVAKRDPEQEKLYKTLKDTFNAFDKDGNAELGYPEYREAWKFLNRPGGEKDIKKAFDSVDIDGSGLIEWSEFVFSMMGESALKLGTLADLELLDELLTDAADLLSGLKDELETNRADVQDRKSRNAELRQRMEAMKKQSNGAIKKNDITNWKSDRS